MGAIYSVTNALNGNEIAGFGRRADGTLMPLSTYATGGNGGVYNPEGGGLDPLISEDALVAVDNRYLLAVNAGSNSIASLAINPDFSLSLVGTAPTNGFGPNSIAQRNGIVYVANVDSDGTPMAVPGQSGNLAGFRFDPTTGRLTALANSTRQLTNRPGDIEFSPDGRYLLVAGFNAGSAMLATSDGTEELVVYAVNTDGTLSANPVAKAASTLPNNAARRSLPGAIGFEIVQLGTRTVVIVTESREFQFNGAPGMLSQFQTGSVSTWELRADGSLAALSQDVLTGPRVSTGTASPTSACWISVAPDRSVFWVAHASGSVITTFALNADGTIRLIGRDVQGIAADPTAADPLAGADGFTDIVVTTDGKYVYQLFDLKGTINSYPVGASGRLSPLLQSTRGLLPRTNSIGLVSVDAITR